MSFRFTISEFYEELREQFKPEKTRILFVGESRPKNETFFYKNDSNLSRYMLEAFRLFRPSKFTPHNFLKQFKASDCYLIDLCTNPVNGLTKPERRRAHLQGESHLRESVLELRPEAVIVIIKCIIPSVDRALATAVSDSCPRYYLPFPAQGHQREYVNGLHKALKELNHAGII